MSLWQLALLGIPLLLHPSALSAQTITISNLWSISPSEGRAYLTNASASSYTERGVAYNPVNNHAYIVSRQGGVKIAILDGDTGGELGFLNVTGVTGGTFALSTISVTDDGSIYAANLTTGSASSPFKVYRWADELSAPVNVYSSNPSVGANNNRYGEAMDARGTGTNTEILVSANGAPIVAIIRPTDETLATFASTRIDVTGIGAADLTKGLGFGPTNTFFGKNNGTASLRHCVYSTDFGTGAVLTTYSVLTGIGPMDADPINNLIAGVETANATSPHNLRVYDISSGSAVLLSTTAFPSPASANGNVVGEAQITGGRIFAIDTQNGVIMSKILVDTNVSPPSVTAQPASVTVVEGGYVTLSVAATGTKPLQFQWSLNGTPILGATTNVFSITNLNVAQAGSYTVQISNPAGLTNSDAAVVTLSPAPLNDDMRVLWKLAPGSRSYLTADNTQRGIAYNPVSGNVLLVSRAPTNAIHVLDGETGDFKYSMNLGSGLITGGTIALNMIACTEDGQVFAANLTTDGTSTSKLRVYGWLDDAELEAPYLAWEGDPGNGNAQRWGDNLDARINNQGTEVLVGSRNGKIAAILRPDFGPNSAPNPITVDDAEAGAFGLSISFGDGSTFYGKSSGTALRKISYDLTTSLGTTVSINTNYPNMNVVCYEPSSGLLAGITRETPDTLRLLNPDLLDRGDATLDTEFFLTDNDNPNGTGQIAMSARRIFAVQSNNGLIAVAVSPRLRVTMFEKSLILSWTGRATLQGTPSLDQSFEDIPNATSGYTVDLPTTGNRYFRLKE